MSEIQLVTDSTSAIPRSLFKKHNIHMVPINIVWDGQTFADGVDLSRVEFFERLKKSYHVPTTAAPTPGAFKHIFSKLVKDGKPIMAILMGSEFSSTLRTAQIAAELIPGDSIKFWDSHSISMGLGFQVLAAARAGEQGKSLGEIKDILVRLRSRTGVLFAVDDLSYLHRGGRLSRSQFIIANTLGYRPILEARDGPIITVDRVRTERSVRARMLDLIEKRVGDERPLRLSVGYTDNKELAESVLNTIQVEFEPDEAMLFPISQANSIHGGCGTYGIAYSFGI